MTVWTKTAQKAILIAMLLMLSSDAWGGVPFPPLSTCIITITQFLTRTSCITGWEPDVVRLTPAGSAAVPIGERVSIATRVRDAAGEPVGKAVVLFSEQSGIVNIAEGGSTTAVTDSLGFAAIVLHGASGYGRIAVCADGVALCEIQVRSPDVAQSPQSCSFGAGTSFVNGYDITHPQCGFLAHFGAVTIGVNDGYDFDCTGAVNGSDIVGTLSNTGVLRFFGDGGTLGAQNACALP
jgi:hypothetical protein